MGFEQIASQSPFPALRDRSNSGTDLWVAAMRDSINADGDLGVIHGMEKMLSILFYKISLLTNFK